MDIDDMFYHRYVLKDKDMMGDIFLGPPWYAAPETRNTNTIQTPNKVDV